MADSKKTRAPNFTKEEQEALLNEIEERQLFCTFKYKNAEWEDLADTLNVNPTARVPRTAVQYRKKFMNLKFAGKWKMSINNIVRALSPGGEKVPDLLPLTPYEKRVLKLLGIPCTAEMPTSGGAARPPTPPESESTGSPQARPEGTPQPRGSSPGSRPNIGGPGDSEEAEDAGTFPERSSTQSAEYDRQLMATQPLAVALEEMGERLQDAISREIQSIIEDFCDLKVAD